jgi:hypothetical protein
MQVDRMIHQAKSYKPQFAIKRFQEDIKQMEEAVSQFHRIGNRTELGAGEGGEGGGNGGSGGGRTAETTGAKTSRSRRSTE